MKRNQQSKSVWLAVVSALFLADTNASHHHHEIYRVPTPEDQVQEGSLRGQRKRRSTQQLHDLTEDTTSTHPRRLRRSLENNQRRTQTLVEELNQRVDKIGIDTFYNPKPKPNRPGLMQVTNRLNKVAWELYYDEDIKQELRFLSMVSSISCKCSNKVNNNCLKLS